MFPLAQSQLSWLNFGRQYLFCLLSTNGCEPMQSMHTCCYFDSTLTNKIATDCHLQPKLG